MSAVRRKTTRKPTTTVLLSLLLVALAHGPVRAQDPSSSAATDSNETSSAGSPTSPGARERFRWPVRGRILKAFNSDGNDGIDIAARPGEAVHCAADGVVTYAGEELQSYGKLILVRHADGYVSVYAGNSELEVAEGDTVKRGQIIAKSGQTGAAATPRLHFELRKDGKPVDPTKQLAPL